MNQINPFGAHLKISAFAIISLRTSLANIGAFITIAGLLNIIYERNAKISFFRDVFFIMTESKNISESGAIDFERDSKSNSYGELLKLSTSVTTVLSYSSRFLTDYHEAIDHIIKTGKSITCIFLNKNSSIVKKMIEDGLSEKSIMGNYETIESFLEKNKNNENVKIIFADYIPRYRCIQFDFDMFVVARRCGRIDSGKAFRIHRVRFG
jgi:hypothetical protein